MFEESREDSSLLSCLPDMVFVLDERGHILSFSPACKMLGYETDELVGEPFDVLLPIEERGTIEHVLSVIKEWGRYDLKMTVLTRDGRAIDVMCAATRTEHCVEPMFALFVMKSISKEEGAIDEGEVLARLLEDSNDGVMLLDDQLRIVMWSAALERITGFSDEDVRGRSLEQVLDWLKPADVRGTTPTHEPFMDALTRLLSGETSEFLKRPRTARITARDESEHFIEVRAGVLEQEHRSAAAAGQDRRRLTSRKSRMLLVFVRDITEQRLASERLEQLVSMHTAIASMAESLLTPKRTHDAIYDCLAELERTLSVDEVGILKLEKEGLSLINDYIGCDARPMLERLEHVSFRELSPLLEKLRRGAVHTSHGSDDEPSLAALIGAGTISLAPIYAKGGMWGLLALAKGERSWECTPECTQIVKTASELLGMRIEHHENVLEIKRQRDFVHELLETTQALVVMLDTEGKITYFNNACERATGYRAEEVIGKPIWEVLIPERYLDAVKGVFSDLVKTKLPSRYENPLLVRSGGERIISWSNTVLADGGVLAIGIDITDRKKAEEQLKERDELLDAVLGSLSEHIAVLDADGTIISVNDSWRRFALENEGTEVSTCEGVSYLKVCERASHTSEDAKSVYEGLKSVLEGRIPRFRLEYDSSSPDEERWYMMYITPLKGKGGAVVSHIDITERKKTERALERALRFERAISDISSRFVGAQDLDEAIEVSLAQMGTVSGASRAYIFLLDEDRTTASNTHEWCASGVKPQKDALQRVPIAAYQWWLERLRTGEPIIIEDVSQLPPEASPERGILERQDIVSLLVLPIYARGELVGFVGFDDVVHAGEWGEENVLFLRLFSEIVGTAIEREMGKRELMESERRYRNLAEQLPDPLIEVDTDFSITYANRAALKEFGYTQEDIASGLTALEIVPEERHAELLEKKKIIPEKAPTGSVEWMLRRADGSEFIADIHFAPMYRENEVVGMRGVVRDITERKHYELALLEAKREAELYVDLMAHDINNLNTVAYGYLCLLAEDKNVSEKHRRAIKRALSSIEGITRLISNVHRLREISHTKRELVPVDVDATVRASLLEAAGDAGVVDYEPCGLKVLADPLLTEVVSNLVGNAIKHGGEGVHVWIRAVPEEDKVRLLIEDNGGGIPDALKPVIFDRLKRGKGSVHGKGLGLHIVSTLVESYGGRVWVEDRVEGKPEEGARFVVELKRVDEA